MPLITRDFFVADIELPGRESEGTKDGLQDFIYKYEPIFLHKALGYQFGKLFYDDVTGNAPTQRMLDIKNGKEYQVGVDTKYWQGLIQEITEGFFVSPMANYVYLQWRRKEATSTGNTGESKPQVANSNLQNAVDKMVVVNNEMAKTIRSLHEFLNANKSVYPEWNIRRVDPYLCQFTNSFGI